MNNGPNCSCWDACLIRKSRHLHSLICQNQTFQLLAHFFRSRFHRTLIVRVIFNRHSSPLKLFTPKFHFVLRRGGHPINCHHVFKCLLWLLTFFSKKFYNWSLLQIEQFLRNLTHWFTWHVATLTESHWAEAAYVTPQVMSQHAQTCFNPLIAFFPAWVDKLLNTPRRYRLGHHNFFLDLSTFASSEEYLLRIDFIFRFTSSWVKSGVFNSFTMSSNALSRMFRFL